jgi:hypothetical protein
MALIILIIWAVLSVLSFVYLVFFKKVKYDGYIIVSTSDEGKKTFLLEINKDPDLIETSSVILFKVVPAPVEGMPAE